MGEKTPITYLYDNETGNDNHSLIYHNNHNHNHSDRISSLNYNTLRSVITICCYSLIVCVSLCGNLLVCKVAFGKRKMRTTTNMLIASLACSDLVMTVFNIPFNVARLLLLEWPFGDLLCFLVPFIQNSCVYVSTLTMTVIAMHRWWTITKKTNTRGFHCGRLILVVSIIWLLAFTLSLPHTVFNEVRKRKIYGVYRYRCSVTYPKIDFMPNINMQLFLSIEAFISQYLIPIMIICIVYIKIGFVISTQGRLLSTFSDDRRRQQSEAKRKRIIMLALVVCVFATCWLPINVYYLLVDFKLIRHDLNLFFVCHWFAMSSVCYNPFIYCWLNQSFRKGARKFFLRVCKCRTLPNPPQLTDDTREECEPSKLHTKVTAIDGKHTTV